MCQYEFANDLFGRTLLELLSQQIVASMAIFLRRAFGKGCIRQTLPKSIDIDVPLTQFKIQFVYEQLDVLFDATNTP